MVDARSADEIARLFFPLDRMGLSGTWLRCSPRWRANGSVGSTEMLMDRTHQIVKVKRGGVAFRKKIAAHG